MTMWQVSMQIPRDILEMVLLRIAHPNKLPRGSKFLIWVVVCNLPWLTIAKFIYTPMTLLEYSIVYTTSWHHLDTGCWYRLVSQSILSLSPCNISQAILAWPSAPDNSVIKPVIRVIYDNKATGFSLTVHAYTSIRMGYSSTTIIVMGSRPKMLVSLSSYNRLYSMWIAFNSLLNNLNASVTFIPARPVRIMGIVLMLVILALNSCLIPWYFQVRFPSDIITPQLTTLGSGGRTGRIGYLPLEWDILGGLSTPLPGFFPEYIG